MLSIQMRHGPKCHKKLTSISIFPTVSHTQHAPPIVPFHEAHVGELPSVNALSAGTIMISEIAGLGHETGHYAVELAVLVAVVC